MSSQQVPQIAVPSEKERLEPDKLRADIGKAQADQAKAELEAKELGHWYRPAVSAPLGSLAITIVAAVVSVVNGWINANLADLYRQQGSLQQTNKHLTSDRNALKTQRDALATQVNEMSSRLNSAQTEISKWQRQAKTASTGCSPVAIEGFKTAIDKASIELGGRMVSGRVTDIRGGIGIGRVAVQVYPLFGGNQVARAITDETGNFMLSLSPSGIREIQLTNDGGEKSHRHQPAKLFG